MRLSKRFRAPVSLHPGIPLSRSVSSLIFFYEQWYNIYKQAGNQPHRYIGYDPTGHHGTVRTAEQSHARRATTLPPHQRAFSQPLQRPRSPLARREARPVPVLSPSPIQAKWVQNIQNIHQQQRPGPIRGPAPIPRPAIFANGHHPHVHIAKLPIHSAPLMAGKSDGPVHDIQKSNRWDPHYHAGVKAPGVRPY